MLQPAEIERALVVMAHPDDVDFGAAGTIALLTDAGAHVTYCLVTDGDAGGSDREMSRTDMAALRRREQTAAAEVVGVKDLVFLGRPDGQVVADFALREAISRVIRDVRPQVVIAQSPVRNLEFIYASHPDHLAAGEAAMNAVYPDARNPFAYPGLLAEEGLEPWSVSEMWITQGAAGATAVDITTTLDRKIEALLCHRSQLQDPDGMSTRLRERLATIAIDFGLPEGAFAEAFRVVDTR